MQRARHREKYRKSVFDYIPGFCANRYCGFARHALDIPSSVARDQDKNTSIFALLMQAGINKTARHFLISEFLRRNEISGGIHATRAVYCAGELRRGNKCPARMISNIGGAESGVASSLPSLRFHAGA